MSNPPSYPELKGPSPLPLERFYARWEFEAQHNLSASDPEPVRLRDLLGLMDPEVADAWHHLTLGYVETQGHPLLRAEIAARYQFVQPDQVLVTTGAQEAIYLSIQTLVSSGQHAVVIAPAYELLHEAARACGSDVTMVPLDPTKNWHLDPSEVISAFRPDTSLLVINFPHNPTGALPSQSVFTSLLKECRSRGIRVLSDEVFRGLEAEEGARWPAAADADEHAVSVGDLSKSYGLAGLRVGWIASRDSAFLSQMAILKDYLTICGAGPSQLLALAALRATEHFHSRARSIVTANVVAATAFFADHADQIDWIPPAAGTTAFPRLLEGDADDFCESLAEEEGVLLAPGSLFSAPGGYFRLGLGHQGFEEALPAIARTLRRFR